MIETCISLKVGNPTHLDGSTVLEYFCHKLKKQQNLFYTTTHICMRYQGSHLY